MRINNHIEHCYIGEEISLKTLVCQIWNMALKACDGSYHDTWQYFILKQILSNVKDSIRGSQGKPTPRYTGVRVYGRMRWLVRHSRRVLEGLINNNDNNTWHYEKKYFYSVAFKLITSVDYRKYFHWRTWLIYSKKKE